jgi:hypothetical protein
MTRRPKAKKAQKGHLKEGKIAKLTNDMKSGEQRKSKEKLKLKTPPETNSPLTFSMQALSP